MPLVERMMNFFGRVQRVQTLILVGQQFVNLSVVHKAPAYSYVSFGPESRADIQYKFSNHASMYGQGQLMFGRAPSPSNKPSPPLNHLHETTSVYTTTSVSFNVVFLNSRQQTASKSTFLNQPDYKQQ
jgi:hypothetical protein